MSSNFSSASTTVARPIPSNANLRRTPIIPLASLYPCCGFLCVICSFTFKQPESIGCYSRDVLCCINHEVICCKPTPEPGYRCIFCKQECLDADECITCQQMERQICCYDCRYTMPANADHPCLCTVLFFTFYFENERTCFCCGTIERLQQQNSRHNRPASSESSASTASGNGTPTGAVEMRRTAATGTATSATGGGAGGGAAGRSSQGRGGASGRSSLPPPPPLPTATASLATPAVVRDAIPAQATTAAATAAQSTHAGVGGTGEALARTPSGRPIAVARGNSIGNVPEATVVGLSD
mmetsp:Transcript_15009/g.24964  ORF Transcript_15009/g.24964 Transcript_15009/m.24964 type:complete len:298 (+) Transcript_15009:65-958(+)